MKSLCLMSLCFVMLAACSEKENKKASTVSIKRPEPVTRPLPEDRPEDSSEVIKNGMFVSTLRPLNSNVAGNVNGSATFIIDKEDFSVEVSVNGAPANTIHGQYIQMGNDCPDESADTNQDGYVDYSEGLASMKSIIIPLDGDIQSQLLDSYIFPASDMSGTYTYKQTASVSQMSEDLQMDDENPDDEIIKLGEKEKLNLEGKVLVIYGLPQTTELPATVASLGSFMPYASLPIACGKITQLYK